ncbi:calcium-activated potassium channel subunit beta-2 isoform X2 [Pangasianodon hypophthalmus]|uniref:calcium-activated potassium channel subunit beta-2 isoform X2 n=1 Tax=Pangasianodon hypophthalmus TaxID=310915 RepID=UPI002307EA48|nr:calcium-activated potassium channel subunit beta-2 isoform X2 [Pangasianodon hypophthalmus]
MLCELYLRAFQSSLQRPSSGRSQHRPSGKTLLVTERKVSNEKSQCVCYRSIYQMLRGPELLERKRTETALKAGEDRAILLGLGMIFCSTMMYFVTCITGVRSYSDSKWTEKSMCTILNISVTEEMNCSYSCGVDCSRSSTFPCVQVYVSLNSTNRVGLLHHNEESENTGYKCFYIPKCQKAHAAIHAVIMNVSEKLREQRHIPCYYDPSDHQANFLLSRLYGSSAIFLSFFWPSCMLAGGATIILLVKLTQYLSILCEHISKRSK